LITHRIGVDVCFARQRTFFHKCHRCIYRGKAASWEPDEPMMAMINLAPEESAIVGVKEVTLPLPSARKKAPAKGRAAKGKSAAAKAARSTEA
jgi:hypothetical protein